MVDENKPVVDAIQKSEANEERRHQESQDSEKKTEGALKEVTKSIQVFNKEETKENKKQVKAGIAAAKELERIEKEIEELVGKAADHEDIEKLLKQSGNASLIQERDNAVQTKQAGKAAEEALKADEEQTKAIKKQTGISQKQLREAQKLDAEIAEQNKKQEELKKTLQELGLSAEDNKKFQQGEKKIAKLEKRKANQLGSKDAEEKADKKIRDKRSNTLLGNIANKMTDIAKGTKEKVKGGIMGMLKGVAFGAFVLAILAFINSPYFDKTMKVLKDFIVPGLAFLYDNVLAPIGRFFGTIIDFVNDAGETIGIEGLGTKIAGTLAALVGLFTVGMFFAPFITMGLLKGGKWLFLAPLKLAFKGISLAFKKLIGGVKGVEKTAQGAVKGATATTGAAAKGATVAAKGATVAAAGAAKPLSGFAQMDQKAKALQKAAQPAGRTKLSSVTGSVKDKLAHLKKFPGLMKVAKKLPFIGTALSGALLVTTLLDESKSTKEKVGAVGSVFGGMLGGLGGAKIGALVGALGTGPAAPIGALVGGIGGSIAGYFAGDYIGAKLAEFLMTGKQPEKTQTPQTAGRGGGRAGRGRGPTATPKMQERLTADGEKVFSSNLPKPGQEGYDDLTLAQKKESAYNAQLARVHEGMRAEAMRQAQYKARGEYYDGSGGIGGNVAAKMTPTRGAPPTTPPPVLSASNNVNAPSTTNVTQNSTSMVNKDRVIDNLNYVY